jgi:hypothetical protein
VLLYIKRQKDQVHNSLVSNEKIEIEAAEIDRNIEWVVKATVGTLYSDTTYEVEKNTKYQEHGTNVPMDISVHTHILELIFALLLVNPSYLLRLYTSFVSDSSRQSRRLLKNMNINNDNKNKFSKNKKKNFKKNLTNEKDIPERIFQHNLRFIDLVFDVYGNLESRYNENRFLTLLKEIFVSEMTEISERTGGNFPLFVSRFASGTTVFCRLASRYLQSPHIVKAGSKVLQAQLSSVLDKLNHGSSELQNIYRNRLKVKESQDEVSEESNTNDIKTNGGGGYTEKEIEEAYKHIDPIPELYTFDSNPNRVECYLANYKTLLYDLNSNMSTKAMNAVFEEDLAVHSEVERRIVMLKSVSSGIFGTICRSSNALPNGVLILVTLIYRQIHKTFKNAISEGGLDMLNLTKLIISKFVMDHLYAPIITDPKKYGIVSETELMEMNQKNKKGSSSSIKTDDVDIKKRKAPNSSSIRIGEKKDDSSSLLNINLEILSDTLRHMSSNLEYNQNARWLHSLDNHAKGSKLETIAWATSMIKLGADVPDLTTMLVDDMYRAHVDSPYALISVGLERIQYLRYCFHKKYESLISSKRDIMYQLLFAPQGMGFLSREEDIKAANLFPLQCEMSDYRNLTGTGRIEKVTINMMLQKRFLTKKSIKSFLQWNNNKDTTIEEKTQEVQMRSKKWGDIYTKNSHHLKIAAATTNGEKNANNNDGILDLFLDSTSKVPLPMFLSSPDAKVIDTARQMIDDDNKDDNEKDGKIALREVIRSMDSLPDKVSSALPSILNFIKKQQGLPLGLRDWDKAKRYQLAYEFLTTGSNNGGMMNNYDEFINLMCEYLMNLENRSSIAIDLKMEILRLNHLQKKAEEWSNHLKMSKNISEQYLNELLCNNDKSSNQITKEHLIERGVAKKNGNSISMFHFPLLFIEKLFLPLFFIQN